MLQKPEEKPKEPKLSDSWYNISEETMNIIIDLMKDARTVNKGTSAELEIKLLRERARLSSEEMNWLRLSARKQILYMKDAENAINKHQIARYEAWVIRLIANKQTIPSVVLELDKMEHHDDVD